MRAWGQAAMSGGLPLDSKDTCVSFPRSRAGFTLMELVVAIAVVGLIMGITISQMDRVFDTEMKNTSNRLASTIRYLYNKSAMEGLYIRLVFDIDERSYWVEATSDPFILSRESEASEKKALRDSMKDKKEKDKEKSKDSAAGKSDMEEALDATGIDKKDGEESEGSEPKKFKIPEPKFSPIDEHLLKPTKLPSTVFFKDIQVEHRRIPVEGGKESIYFFPNGYVERAIINFRDEEDETHYSLITNPVSGKVDIEDRYRSIGE